ncbi:MAG TPA: glycosyltransferase family 39 protein [Anaerolineae bacterium]|nr:glycosyltransferase family 39 protein [Anaerolineae bacterium]
MKPSLHWARLRDQVLLALSALVVLLPISPLVLPQAGRDSGVFLYVGWRILHGEIPYLHLWDHKPPLIFYLNALGLWLSGGSKWGVWLIELAALLLATTLGFKLIKRAFGTQAAVVSLALWLASLIYVIQGGNLTTEYTLPLQFACLWLATGLDVTRYATRRIFAIGLLCGLIFWTKQNAAGIGIAVALYLIISRSAARQWGRLGRDLVSLASGFAILSAAVVAYFATRGALTQLWDAAFVYNLIYAVDGPSALLQNLGGTTRYLFVTGLLPLALIGYGVAVWAWLSKAAFFQEHRALLSVALLGLPIEFLLFNLSGRSYPHYAMTLLPFLALFAGLAVWAIMGRLAMIQVRDIALAGASLALLLVVAGARYYAARDQIARSRAGAQVSSIIEQSTAPSDTVLLWGAETSINFFSQRASPSRFSYQFPLYHPAYTSEALITEFLDAILAERPRMIIDTGNPATPIFDFPITTPAIQQRIEAIQAIYRVTGDLGGGTLYEPVSAIAP